MWTISLHRQHEYGEIDDARIWRVVTVHIPQLIGVLEELVPQGEQGDHKG